MNTLRRLAIRTHRVLAWPAAVALLMFIVSGLCHPLMVWTGPRAAAFFAPQIEADGALLAAAQRVIAEGRVPAGGLIKLVPGPGGALIQQSDMEGGQRRYVDPASGNAMPDQDRLQAIWLARYYAGDQGAPLASVSYRDSFDTEYPAVNRLLPVWRIAFARTDGLRVWVHTETGELASISNRWKDGLQSVFQWLHTQKGLEGMPWLRFLVMNVLMGVLLVFALAGTLQVLLLPRRRIPRAARRWHRWLALALYVPLLGILLSGFHHLWFTELDTSIPGQRLVLDVDTSRPLIMPETAAGSRFDRMALVQTRNGHRYWRLGIPGGTQGHAITRAHHFDGAAAERGARYLPADSYAPSLSDEDYAMDLARRVLGDAVPVIALEPVTKFGPDYDFRNKRLPVWRLRVAGESLFVDTASGVLVERVGTARRLEALDFGVLHKWNPLAALVGRAGRDVLVGLFLASLLTLMMLGLVVRRGRADPA